MRTDPLNPTTRWLLALLLLGTAAPTVAPLVAQAEAPPAEQEADTPEAAPLTTGVGSPDAAVQESGDRVSVLGGNRTIAENESVRDAVVIGGSLDVRGTVRGDAVVVGGNLTLHPTGRIGGDLVVAGGRFQNLGGDVAGETRTMDRVPVIATGETRVRTESVRHRPFFRRIGSGLAGIVSTAALVLVLGAMGAAAVFYAQRYLETVADTLRSSTGRSTLVGIAASFLVVPAFIVLVVALVVSIVGIPLLILAVPLYPLAVVAASLFGLIAAAYALGDRTAEQRRPYQLRHHNAYAYLATGLVLLFGPVMMGHLIGMVPFLGWVGILIKFVTYGLIWVAMLAGLGAVILSRAGTRRTFAGKPPAVEEEPLYEDDPFLERSDV